MDHEAFWRLIDEVRDRASCAGAGDDETLRGCVVDVLAERLTGDELLAFDATASDLASQADTPAMVGAMFLIEGYVSDDSFMDFRDGLILLGRDVYETAVDDPDSLAGHPAARPGAAQSSGFDCRAEVSFDSVNSCVMNAWVRVTGATDEDDFWAVEALSGANLPQGDVRHGTGETWQVNDRVAITRRLPRLSELYAHRFSPHPTTMRLSARPPGDDLSSKARRARLSDYQSGFDRARSQQHQPSSPQEHASKAPEAPAECEEAQQQEKAP